MVAQETKQDQGPAGVEKTKTGQVENITTPEVLGIRAIGLDGTIAHSNGKFSVVRKLEAIDAEMMAGVERTTTVMHGAEYLNTLTRPVSFYLTLELKNMQPYLAELAARRRQEINPRLKEMYFIEEDHLRSLSAGLVERNYYITFNSLNDEIRKQPASSGISGLLKERYREIVEKDDGEENLEKDPEQLYLNPTVAAQLRFVADSAGDAMSRFGMSNHLLSSEALALRLAERLNSPYAGYATKSNMNSRLPPLDLLGGAALVETPGYLCFTDNTSGRKRYAATLYITGYPRIAGIGTLKSIVSIKDFSLQLGVHLTPWQVSRAQKKLKSREQILYATRPSEIPDMEKEYTLDTLQQLRRRIARGEGKIFKLGVRIAVFGEGVDELNQNLLKVKQRLEEMGYSVATATYNQRRAFLSTLPTGRDWLTEGLFSDRTLHPNATAENIICHLPNIIPDTNTGGGIILGVNRADGSLVTFNRWNQTNPHTVVVATSGGGKTVSLEQECMRELTGDPELQVIYLDPQDVQRRLCEVVDGQVVDLGPKGNAVINPLDKYILNGREDETGERLSYLYALVELMLKSTITSTDRTGLKNALERLYSHFEEGESLVYLLEANFRNLRMYTAARDYLHRWVDSEGKEHLGIVERLQAIYHHLEEKYRIPPTGFVAGAGSKEGTEDTNRVGVVVNGNSNSARLEPEPPSTGMEYQRPICHLDRQQARYFYAGGGMTSHLLSTGAFDPIDGKYGAAPPPVWYPDPAWYINLWRDFCNLVQQPDESGNDVFWMLDRTAREQAITDSFVELKRGQPVLSDLQPILAGMGYTHLVESLDIFTSHKGFGPMFNGFTNVRLDKRWLSFNVVDLDENFLRPIRMFQVINLTWGITRAIKRPRMFVIDEFALLLESESQDVGHYAAQLFMRGRKFYLAMTAVVQNILYLLDYKAGLVCKQNADRIVLLRQQEEATDRLREKLRITFGQSAYLTKARPGESLQKINDSLVAVKYDVPDFNLKIFDTRPQKDREESSAQEKTGRE